MIADIIDAADRIINLCESPHWTTDCKQRIASLAEDIKLKADKIGEQSILKEAKHFVKLSGNADLIAAYAKLQGSLTGNTEKRIPLGKRKCGCIIKKVEMFCVDVDLCNEGKAILDIKGINMQRALLHHWWNNQE